MVIPNPVRLFHITAIANFPGICAARALLSKSAGNLFGIAYQNIAHAGAQGARSIRTVPDPPGGVVHDFVPFYFAPRSPMLYALNGGKVAGCGLRQEDVAHLETTIDRVTAGGNDFVFYDRNATLAFSQSFTDLARLDAIAWDLLIESPQLDGFCKYWQNKRSDPRYVARMERRQAEFLVKGAVDLGRFVRIGVIDENRASIVRAILTQHGINLPVEVKRDWYFLGQ